MRRLWNWLTRARFATGGKIQKRRQSEDSVLHTLSPGYVSWNNGATWHTVEPTNPSDPSLSPTECVIAPRGDYLRCVRDHDQHDKEFWGLINPKVGYPRNWFRRRHAR